MANNRRKQKKKKTRIRFFTWKTSQNRVKTMTLVCRLNLTLMNGITRIDAFLNTLVYAHISLDGRLQ